MELEYDARFLSVKHHKWRGSYQRIIGLSHSGIMTMEAGHLGITNKWLWFDEVVDITTSTGEDSSDEFVLHLKKGKKIEQMKFSTDSLECLLCTARSYMMQARGEDMGKEFNGYKIGRNGDRKPTTLTANSGEIVEYIDDRAVAHWPYHLITSLDVLDDEGGMCVNVYSRKRVFIIPSRDEFIKDCTNKAKQCGVTLEKKKKGGNIACVMKEREHVCNDFILSTFEVHKVSARHTAPIKRIIQITENSFIERDPETFTITSLIALSEVSHLIRQFNEPQIFSIEFNERPTRRYLCTKRDALLGGLLDICQAVGLRDVMIQVVETAPGIRIHTAVQENKDDMEDTSMRALIDAGSIKADVNGINPPYTNELFGACCEFNANVGGTGTEFRMKEKQLMNAYHPLIEQLNYCLDDKGVPEKICAVFWEALYRLILRTSLSHSLMNTPGIVDLFIKGLESEYEGVVFWVLEVMKAVCVPDSENRITEVEKQNKEVLLGSEELCNTLLQLLDTYSSKPTGTMCVLALTEFFELCLCGYADTTNKATRLHLLSALSERHSILLSLFHSSCSGITTSTALIMKTIVEECQKEIAQLMQDAALSEGVLLKHFYLSLFSSSEDQRYISRCLVSLWMGDHKESRDLLKRMLPMGMERFLEHKSLTKEQVKQYVIEERNALAGDTNTKPSRATSRLRSRITDSKKLDEYGNFNLMFFMCLKDHNNYSMIWNYTTRNELKLALEKELNTIEKGQQKSSSSENVTKPMWNHEEFFVEYESLRGELVVDGIYIKYLLSITEQANEVKLSNPAHSLLSIYTRMLREDNFDNKVMCVRAMTVVYFTYGKQIGVFVETNHIMQMIHTTSHLALRDHLIVFIRTLMSNPLNVDLLLREVDWNMELLMDLLSMAHTASSEELHLSSILQASIIQSSLLLTAGPSKSKTAGSKTPQPASTSQAPVTSTATKSKSTTPVATPVSPSIAHPPSAAASAVTSTKQSDLSLDAPDPDFDVVLPLNEPPKVNVQSSPSSMSFNDVGDPDFDVPLDMFDSVPGMLPTVSSSSSSSAPTQTTTATTSPVPSQQAKQTPSTTSASSASADSHTESTKSDENEGVAEWWYIQGDDKVEHGPVKVSRLQTLLKRNLLTPASLVRADNGKYLPLSSIRQLKWQLLMEGGSYLSPISLAVTILDILNLILNCHDSFTPKKVLKTPIPRAKRVLGTHKYLCNVAQLLLIDNPKLVSYAADTLSLIVANNENAMGKLYLTGIFYFCLGYSGSNYQSIGKLLYQTHLQQNFRMNAEALTVDVPISKRSILGTMLPESMICILENYGGDSFANNFLGNFDTPEVIWKYEMRKHLVEEVLKHIGEFPKKLRENPTLLFDYGPIPEVKYPELELEMWCHNFFIAALCDEKRFPDWPIRKPVDLLRAVLDSWRLENAKQPAGVSEDEAYAILGFTDVNNRPDENTLKKEYRRLARLNHPDKNPEGRELFEKIQKAFELLNSTRVRAGGPDPVNIMLMLRVQVIIYRRFSEKLANYKYAGYPLLLPLLTLADDQMLTSEMCPQLEVATSLLYYTCACTEYNCKEFIRDEGLISISSLLSRCTVLPDTEATDARFPIAEHIMHTLAYSASLEVGRNILETLENAIVDIARFPTLLQRSNAVEYSLEAIANCALSGVLQNKLMNGTVSVLWSVLPLLFRFDPTLEEKVPVNNSTSPTTPSSSSLSPSSSTSHVNAGKKAGGRGNDDDDDDDDDDESPSPVASPPIPSPSTTSSSSNNNDNSTTTTTTPSTTNPSSVSQQSHTQSAANNNSKRAALALARLGGYCVDKKAPRNKVIRGYLSKLLTSPIASKLSDSSPEELLTILNTHREEPRLIWKGEMKQQLLEFVEQRREDQSQTGNGHLDMINDFIFEAIKDELIIGDVYVRVYIACKPKDFENSDVFLLDLLMFLRMNRDGASDESDAEIIPTGKYIPTCKVSWCQMTLTALKLLLSNTKDICQSVKNPKDFRTLFSFIEPDNDNNYDEQDRLRDTAVDVMRLLAPVPVCSQVIAKERLIQFVMKLLYADLYTCRNQMLTLLCLLCETTESARECIRLNGIVLGLYCLTREEEKVGGQYRMLASKWLSIMCSDVKEGPKATIVLRRFLPFDLSVCVRENNEMLCTKIDAEHETPELIWTGHMKEQLRQSTEHFTDEWNRMLWNDEEFVLPENYYIKYNELMSELFVGNVYIKLFLKDPKYPLRDPKLFLEGCFKLFLSEAKYEIAKLDGKEIKRDTEEMKYVDATQPEKIKEHILSIVTSGIVCLLKVNPMLAEHVAMLGYIPELIKLLRKSSVKDPNGDLTMSIIRIFHDLAGSKVCAQKMAEESLLRCFKKIMSTPGPDAAYVMETLRLLFKCNKKGFTGVAVNENYIEFLMGLLKHEMKGVSDIACTKVNVIDIIKIMERDERNESRVNEQLSEFADEWEHYKHQKHDLFISKNEKADRFISQSVGTLSLEDKK